jgi:hypothetical protein
MSKALAHQELVDELLRAWGSDIGSDRKEVARMDWPQHSILYRIIRDGPGASQNGAPPLDLTEMAFEIDRTVAKIKSEKTREVLKMWYCENKDDPQWRCAQRMKMRLRTFELHLALGRSEFARILGVVE